ncbi:MAG: aspartate kinase [Bacteroidetes bacterium]|nr:aspartate kinase [Bacteroidota bacterium]
MSALKINIVLFGIGNIGSTLVRQVLESRAFFLENYNIDLRFPVITNSTVAFFEKDGLPHQWETNFAQAAIPFQIQDILDYVQAREFDNLIAVDATASWSILEHYTTLIENGFDLVAANKKANTQSFEFYQSLREHLAVYQKQFLYETNVGAALPVIKTLRNLYDSGEKITRIRGVFSGSLSYVFNRFSEEEAPFSSILEQAEQLGLTEPDSREDLSGQDVARKLLILARELGHEFEFTDVQIQSLLPTDLPTGLTVKQYKNQRSVLDQPLRCSKIAQAENRVLRYVGQWEVAQKTLEVKLISVPKNSALGQLKGADNLIEIYTTSYQETPLVIQGAGAGKEVTARGVLSDILQLAQQIKTRSAIWI